MQIKDEKARLRAYYKKLRADVSEPGKKSAAAAENLLSSEIYAAAEQVLCYYSVGFEMGTVSIIEAALGAKKKIALPVCMPGGADMEFYYIAGLSDIKPGAFGIPAPDVHACARVRDYSHALVVVPAIAFDKNGARLGYGGGYYDRFLEKLTNSTSNSVGMCYNELVRRFLPREAHDISVDYICTEKRLFKI
ncbi:MAG: 5-formyltetrahydrofolate cyclo-ligase [Clostridiales bacterium]|nr:5-formyltetrahydrofolate cyclo-ligase [Clostridiales bacterium]